MSGAAAMMLCLALCLASTTAGADTLVAANGDRVSGRLVEDKGGRIVFDSDLFGRLELASDQVRVERAESPTASAATPPIAAAPADPAKWTLDLGLKLGVDRGELDSYEDRVDGRLVLDRKTARGELHGTASYKYKADDNLDDDDWAAALAYDQFLSDTRFRSARLRLSSELTNDQYDNTQVASVAGGWRLWETPEHYLRIGPALGYVSATRGDESFRGAFVGVYARGKASLPYLGQLTGELQLADTMGDGRYADLDIRLRKPLTDRLFVAVGWSYVWSEFAIESGYQSEWRWELGWRLGDVD